MLQFIEVIFAPATPPALASLLEGQKKSYFYHPWCLQRHSPNTHIIRLDMTGDCLCVPFMRIVSLVISPSKCDPSAMCSSVEWEEETWMNSSSKSGTWTKFRPNSASFLPAALVAPDGIIDISSRRIHQLTRFQHLIFWFEKFCWNS